MDTTLINKRKKVFKKRVGRGGNRGKTCGRGTKGQKARAGHSIKPAFRDIFASIPKLRGHGKTRARGVNSGRPKIESINISMLDKYFEDGARITPQILVLKKLVPKAKGKKPFVKILGNGDLSKKFIITNCFLSKTAKEKIESAGGVIHTY